MKRPPPARVTFDVEMADGASIRVRCHGRADGPRILASHGNGFAVDGYWPFWATLAPHYQLVLYDLRNHGANPLHTQAGHRLASFVADLERLLNAVQARLGPAPTAGLYHSISAVTALTHALEHGWRWDALVVVDPPLIPPRDHALYPLAHDFEMQIARWAAARECHFAGPEVLTETLLRARSRSGWVDGAHAQMARAVLRRSVASGEWTLACPGSYEAQIYADNARTNLAPHLHELVGPLLFVCADPQAPDAWPPARLNAALRTLHPHATVSVPGTTHMLQIEQPAAVAALVTAFLEAHGLAPAERP